MAVPCPGCHEFCRSYALTKFAYNVLELRLYQRLPFYIPLCDSYIRNRDSRRWLLAAFETGQVQNATTAAAASAEQKYRFFYAQSRSGQLPPRPLALSLTYHKGVMQYKKPNQGDLQLSNSVTEPINHSGLNSTAVSLQARSIASVTRC